MPRAIADLALARRVLSPDDGGNMKKHAIAKLRLDRETLSPLSADTLVRIHGGQDAGERRLTPDCSLPPSFRNCNSRIVCNA